MTARLAALAFDALAPDELALFWADALRWGRSTTASSTASSTGSGTSSRGGGLVELVPTDATSFGLLFRTSDRAKAGQNRIHLDLTTTSLDDQRETVTELLANGARHIDIGQGPDETHVVLADPEGNELCIIEPSSRFLAGCPRLGAVNCDGTRALGHFFAAALGWPLVWDQDEETAIQAPDGTGPKITWSGPPLMPRIGPERLHLHLAPTPGASVHDTLDHLLALGATHRTGEPSCPASIALTDVDGNPLCLIEP